jgi:hypothetical protein
MPFYFNVLDAFYFVGAQLLLLRKWWRTMSLIQFLLLAIAGISLVLASDLVRASYQSRKRQQVDVMPGWRGVGTFGKFDTTGIDATVSSSGPISIKTIVVLIALAALGICFKFAWDEAHPDIRTRYGRAYERCVIEEKTSRWKINEVHRCAVSQPWNRVD